MGRLIEKWKAKHNARVANRRYVIDHENYSEELAMWIIHEYEKYSPSDKLLLKNTLYDGIYYRNNGVLSITIGDEEWAVTLDNFIPKSECCKMLKEIEEQFYKTFRG